MNAIPPSQIEVIYALARAIVSLREAPEGSSFVPEEGSAPRDAATPETDQPASLPARSGRNANLDEQVRLRSGYDAVAPLLANIRSSVGVMRVPVLPSPTQQASGVAPHESANENASAQQQSGRLSLTPQQFHSLGLMGRSYYDNGLWREATQIFGALVGVNPRSPDAQAAYGSMLKHLNRGEEAMTHLTKAIDLGARGLATFVNRAEVYLQMGDAEAAKADLRRAISLDPQGACPLSRRARAIAVGRLGMTEYMPPQPQDAPQREAGGRADAETGAGSDQFVTRMVRSGLTRVVDFAQGLLDRVGGRSEPSDKRATPSGTDESAADVSRSPQTAGGGAQGYSLQQLAAR